MGNKIFVSYKYSDESVYGSNKTVRTYVDELEDLLKEEDHIYKGEHDDEDLSDQEDEAIEQKLRDRMFDSTVTIVMISPRMKDTNESERNQWIPWEVSYSLKIQNRKKGGKSYPNAILAVTLPDINNLYDYYIENESCPNCQGYRTLMTEKLFSILRKNMFNLKEPKMLECPSHSPVHTGASSYILSVKWHDFKANLDKYIDRANSISDNIEDYNVFKELK